MGKRHIRGSKGALRNKLVDVASQVQELSTIVAALVKRSNGEVRLTSAELAAIKPDDVVDVEFLRSPENPADGVFALTFRKKITGKDITG